MFAEKRQVRGFKWSPDASRLAFLALKDGAFEPMLWVRAANSVRPIALPAGKEAADNAEFEWSASGDEVLFAVRGREWRVEAKKRFESETAATVIVHSSKEPFLAWDDVRRLASTRGVIALRRCARDASATYCPQARISSYALLDDGSALTYSEDVTKKTDYDVIFGVDNEVKTRPSQGGDSRTLLKSTKGLTLIWSRDGRTYAYSKDGKIFTGTVAGGDPRQIAGPMGDEAKKTDAADKDKDPEKKDVERFTAVRLSARGERLVASDKQGLWLVDTASGTKELFLSMPEEDKEAPRYQVVDWSPDGSQVYLSYASRKTWERGLERYDVQAKRLTDAGSRRQDLHELPAVEGRNDVRVHGRRGQPAGRRVCRERRFLQRPPSDDRQSVVVRGRRLEDRARVVSRRRRKEALRRALLSGRTTKAGRSIRPCSKSTRISSTTVSAARINVLTVERLRGHAAVGEPGNRPSGRIVGEGRHGRGEQADRDGHRGSAIDSASPGTSYGGYATALLITQTTGSRPRSTSRARST